MPFWRKRDDATRAPEFRCKKEFGLLVVVWETCWKPLGGWTNEVRASNRSSGAPNISALLLNSTTSEIIVTYKFTPQQHGVHYLRVHHAAGQVPQASSCYLWSHWVACRFHQSPPLHPTASQSLRAPWEERMPAMSPHTSTKLTSNSCGNMDPKALGL
jgi:hypothetical protein